MSLLVVVEGLPKAGKSMLAAIIADALTAQGLGARLRDPDWARTPADYAPWREDAKKSGSGVSIDVTTRTLRRAR